MYQASEWESSSCRCAVCIAPASTISLGKTHAGCARIFEAVNVVARKANGCTDACIAGLSLTALGDSQAGSRVCMCICQSCVIMFRFHVPIKQQVTYETRRHICVSQQQTESPKTRTLHPTANEPITWRAHADHQGRSHPVRCGAGVNGEISSVAVPIFRLLLKIAERLISTSRLTQFFLRVCASTPNPTLSRHPPACLP